VTAQPILETKDLGIQFGGLKAVSELDLVVGDREIVGLIGPNGAGKTTAFNLITCIYCPTTGTISLRGRSIDGLAPHEVTRLGIARTFQNIRLFRNLPVVENVLVGFHCRAGIGLFSSIARTGKAGAREAELRGEAHRLLELMGLESRWDELAGNLSYGDQRRLEIARALASSPQLLLLDEPAAGMSSGERTSLMQLVRDLRERLGIAVLLIEHDMRVVMGVCDRVYVLDHGIPIAAGVPEQIQRDPAVIEAYLGKPEDSKPLRQRKAAR
jgi:branched-chain amino acid transport system ATP-binding protein